MEYLDSLDIANRALQHCGQPPLVTTTDDTKSQLDSSFAYGKVRRAEMQRNTWRFAIRKAVLRALDVDTMLLVPAAYNSATLYLPGAIVSDSNGLWWVSQVENNTGNTPGGNNNAWDAYFGPKTIEPYDTTGGTAYWSGELVYKASSVAGGYNIFMSLENGNTDVPDTATAYNPATTYHGGAVVSYSGSQWLSLSELNLNNTPTAGPAAWVSTTTYSLGDQVTGSDAFVYTSAGNGNTGNDPTVDGGVNWTNTNTITAWTTSPAQPVTSINWRQINATMTTLALTYPLGAGPVSDSDTRNAFRLPAGYLNMAPQDPKEGSHNFLGGPSGQPYEDWDFEGDYLVSRDAGPILFRFTADVTRVVDMTDMFCEGLALSLALAIARSLTQKEEMLQELASEYKLRMGEARLKNFIETGPVEPPEDDWVTCRY